MGDFNSMFPNFLAQCLSLKTLLTPVAFLLVTGGLMASTIAHHRSGNAQLQAIMPTMRLHLLRQQIQSFQTAADRQRRLDEYAAVTRAVLKGDARTAERKTRDHIRRMRGVIAEMPDGAFPSPK